MSAVKDVIWRSYEEEAKKKLEKKKKDYEETKKRREKWNNLRKDFVLVDDG